MARRELLRKSFDQMRASEWRRSCLHDASWKKTTTDILEGDEAKGQGCRVYGVMREVCMYNTYVLIRMAKFHAVYQVPWVMYRASSSP